MRPLILFLLLTLTTAAAQAQQVDVRGARIWPAPDQTRLVIDTTANVSHSIFSLKDPHRLVIDIPDARLTGRLPTVSAGDPLVLGLRSGVRKERELRIVLDLKQPVRAKSFLLQPNQQYGHRLVVDLSPSTQSGAPGAHTPPPPARKAPSARPVIVAIDAGHGGEDPGAIGPKGTREKDITLAIARKLTALVDREAGMKAVLIRDGDYYVGLRKRIQLARAAGADLFVSIHADAFKDRRVRGSSVYTLSQKGASSTAAQWLAERENSADIIGGIDVAEADDVLRNVLAEMSLSATLEHSSIAAQKVLDNLARLGDVHKAQVQRARFMVLKAPDIPSMLVETAFISNPDEEQRLREKTHQQRIAEAILAGVRAYFRSYPPPGTLLASEKPRQHVINRGDTLLDIAKDYDVSLTSLRSANQIDGDLIREGQVLTIPES
jgi:N-acetylmuramoyl-L-alanine amidase